MLCLAAVICTSLSFVEVALNRFQVLPLLFPGMFRVSERRFFFFNFDISDGTVGKHVRAEAKMIARMTICLVLSYLWQHCVLETTQMVGHEFPRKQCDKGADCFASSLHFYTFFNRDYEAVDCDRSRGDHDFEQRVVVSCIRFITPAGTTWLMHLAISHSITQLNFKAFELMVWIGGNSKWARRMIGFLIFLSLLSLLGLFFGGLLSEFVSSWLSFVMSLTIPMFLYTTYKTGRKLERLWNEEAIEVQRHIEEHLSGAFADIETTVDSLDMADGNGKADVDRERSKEKIASIRAREKDKRDSHKVIKTLRNMKSALSNPLRRSRPGRNQGGTKTPESSEAGGRQASNGSSDESGTDSTWMNPGLAATLDGATLSRVGDAESGCGDKAKPALCPPQMAPRQATP